MAAIVAGANGYILKDVTPHQVAQEIRTLVAGGSAISPSIARELLDHVRQVDESTVSAAPVVPSISLTRREHEVLALANKGLTYGEIASNLSLSVHTVKTYVKRAYQKLQVTSKTEAVMSYSVLGKFSISHSFNRWPTRAAAAAFSKGYFEELQPTPGDFKSRHFMHDSERAKNLLKTLKNAPFKCVLWLRPINT